jgi:tRNA(fMet)-specific endonuclease VapC
VVILSFDTNVVVDIVRAEKPHVRSHMEVAMAAGATFKLSTIVLQELVFGAHRSPRPDYHIQRLDEFLPFVEIEAWTADDAVCAGRIRAGLEDRGSRIGGFDTLIAGQALSRGWTLVTADVEDFRRIAGLTLIDWSNPAGPVEYRT